MSNFIIKKSNTFKRILSRVFIIVLCSIALSLLLDRSHWKYIKQQMHWNKEVRLAQEKDKNLKDENAKLLEKVTILERSAQIDNQAANKLQYDIRELQDEIYKLKAELEFYQGVVSTTESKGLNIQGLHIEPKKQEGLFHFRLVLTHIVGNGKMVEASINMIVEGESPEGNKKLSLQDIIIGNDFEYEVKFNHFKQIASNMLLPENFKPLRVIISLKQKGSNKKALKKIYEWPINTDVNIW